MINDLEQFSEERLIEIIEAKFDTAELNEQKALARIALAAKQAKPVGHFSRVSGDGIWFEQWTDKLGVPLYTTPQPAHTEQYDTHRMNWLVSQNVEVRIPMLYGSHARFVAQCDSDDCEEYHTTLREQIDAAMLAAAPKTESE